MQKQRYIKNIDFIDEIHSTNSYLIDLFRTGKVNYGSLIYAGKQSGGRGQSGNIWMAEPGKNITLSFLLDSHNLNINKQFDLNKAISLAVFDYLKSSKIDGVAIKWPNDILVNHQKICGILIENAISGVKLSYSVIGIGLNVNQFDFGFLSGKACSLAQLTGKSYHIPSEIESLASHIEKRLDLLFNNQESILEMDYMNSLIGFRQFRKYKINHSVVSAQIIGINKIGQIILETDSGNVQSYSQKEVEFLYD